MLYCERCGNKEQNIDFWGKPKKTIYFTETIKGFKCHGCGEVIKEEADEYTKEEAETLIKNNEWVNCSIEKY